MKGRASHRIVSGLFLRESRELSGGVMNVI